ncbi:MAG TPA: thioredoxin family protein [Pyrinomonadaceae bacterium]|nr:thioredoxin family protein [Pyrinomonadaceae bacterium]
MRSLKRSLPFFVILAAAQLLVLAGVFQIAGQSKYIPVTRYDPKRDAAQDIQDAVKEAQRAHKRILLEVGGEWCSWCHTLDRFFDTHAELTQLRDKNFVTVKINFSEENTNKDVLSRYEAIPGYPHIFVLDSDGKLLWSQNTSILERDKSYDLERLTVFLTNWAPASKE